MIQHQFTYNTILYYTFMQIIQVVCYLNGEKVKHDICGCIVSANEKKKCRKLVQNIK